MKKVFATLLTVFLFSYLPAQQNRLLDQPMQIKKLSMKVEADCFTATTFLEFEFYNPNDKEIEGLYRFTLLPYQVITGFQLELNGRFRDGSIEEKWKARSAYNTIVGKRVDPALLSLDWNNNYRLNIYPVPAKSSRKVTMTIQQTLQAEKEKLWYRFPFNAKDTPQDFDLTILTRGCSAPSTENGLIAGRNFQNKNDGYELRKVSANEALWQPVNFSFPLNTTSSYCTEVKGGQTYFALRTHSNIPSSLEMHPKKLLIYWDVSGSSLKRNTEREISFLKQYLQKHEVEELKIVAFADQPHPEKIFYPRLGKDWLNYLRSLNYDGATRIDALDFATSSSDMIFLFSDGYVSYGNKKIKAVIKPLYAFSSTPTADSVFLKVLIANSGGSYINLDKYFAPEAVQKASFASIQLLSIQSFTGKTIFEKAGNLDSLVLFGTLPENDVLTLVYGNRSQLYRTDKIILNKEDGCKATAIDRLPMLYRFPFINQSYDWEGILEFGLKEKIVTANTSYIVLEKAEDYVKYNIAPPKELEEECVQQGYITKNTKSQRQQLKQKDEYDILNGIVGLYNQKLKQWDEKTSAISLSRNELLTSNNAAGNLEISSNGNMDPFLFGMPSPEVDEVVVTGYSTARKDITGSISVVQPNLLTGTSVEQALSGRVAGLQVMDRGIGDLGQASQSIRLRGLSSLSGSNEPLFVIDGFPVEGNINDLISLNDIESITVLKNGTAAALYGSRAANGAIVITTKKYRPTYRSYYSDGSYRLKDMPDEDYLEEIKQLSVNEKFSHYLAVRSSYADNPGFHLDMAQHLFESGLKKEAMNAIMNAAEVSNGDASMLTAIAYSFEKWKEWDKAIDIYQQLLYIYPNSLPLHRDLCWALYQSGQVQEAVDRMYNAIKMNLENYEYYYGATKAGMLDELNAMIAIHKDSLNLSRIPPGLIHSMPVDLRIVLSGNTNYISYMQVKEPGGRTCSYQNPVSRNGGYMDRYTYQAGSYYYSPYSNEYNIKKAVKGKYKVSINYYDYYGSKLPKMVRIISFKNYGRKNQSIEVQNVIMNNQNGSVEIGEVEW